MEKRIKNFKSWYQMNKEKHKKTCLDNYYKNKVVLVSQEVKE